MVPVDGETLSQEAPLAVNVVLGLAVREIVLEPGDAPPAMAENDNHAGLTLSVFTGAETFNWTGTLAV